MAYGEPRTSTEILHTGETFGIRRHIFAFSGRRDIGRLDVGKLGFEGHLVIVEGGGGIGVFNIGGGLKRGGFDVIERRAKKRVGLDIGNIRTCGDLVDSGFVEGTAISLQGSKVVDILEGLLGRLETTAAQSRGMAFTHPVLVGLERGLGGVVFEDNDIGVWHKVTDLGIFGWVFHCGRG